ncbi:MAG TPA: PIN domain-containing protein [Acidimicrobiia bacterium]|nr:PIN domain-containing protein [Acidimicrobiia bacterium]
MNVFVDSSGLYALLDADSSEHGAAAHEWDGLRRAGATLRTHSYVVVETAAIVQRRIGMDAALTLHRDVMPVLSVRFVDRELHHEATTSLLAAGRRKVSLVDWASFAVMRNENLTDAFAFDNHFAEQGFSLRPAG